MGNVYFKPYVGKNYNNQNVKVMMLGESHYLWEEEQTPENYYNEGKGLTPVQYRNQSLKVA